MALIRTKEIPEFEIKNLADHFGYDQIILVARRVGDDGAECVLSYGVNSEHRTVARQIAETIKRKYLKWP